MPSVCDPVSDPPSVTFSLATAGFVVAVFCVLLAEYQALVRKR